jgi:SAM-dependent methyltransferase
MELSDHARRNREQWDADAAAYQERNARHINHADPRWGLWQIPEDQLRVLGDVAGRDVLELGCGAAQWSVLLAQRGARVTGLDNSAGQLEFARAAIAEAGVELPLVHGSAESLPFADASFDIVFCDHGAVGFSDPHVVVPEVARVLRPGGRFAFSGMTPIEWITYDPQADVASTTFQRDYFGMHSIDVEGSIEFMLTYGDWVRTFVAAGLEIRDLIEVRPDEGAESSYRDAAGTAWARRWPMEQIWVVERPLRDESARGRHPGGTDLSPDTPGT